MSVNLYVYDNTHTVIVNTSTNQGSVTMYDKTIKLYQGIDNTVKFELKDNDRNSISGLTGYISGCCLLISGNLFEKLNGFNEIFNMYAEDVDLCLRAKELNIHCIYIPNAKIWHNVSSSYGGRYSIRKYIKKINSINKLIKIHNPELNSFFTTLKTIKNIIFSMKK